MVPLLRRRVAVTSLGPEETSADRMSSAGELNPIGLMTPSPSVSVICLHGFGLGFTYAVAGTVRMVEPRTSATSAMRRGCMEDSPFAGLAASQNVSTPRRRVLSRSAARLSISGAEQRGGTRFPDA